MNPEAISFVILLFNTMRLKAGLSELVINKSLETAARWHWRYMVINNELGHYETFGRKGFSGRTPIIRATRAGYPKYNSCVGEVASFSSGVRNSEILGAYLQLNTVYHRGVVLNPDYSEVGVAAGKGYLSALFGSRKCFPRKRYRNKKHEIFFFPYDGMRDFFTQFDSDSEHPDPIKGASVVGSPISVHFSSYELERIRKQFGSFFTYRSRVRFALKEKSSGSPVEFYRVYDESAIYFVPKKPLKPGTCYTAEFVFPDGVLKKVTFRTASRPHFDTVTTSKQRGTLYIPYNPSLSISFKMESRYYTRGGSYGSAKPSIDMAYVLKRKDGVYKPFLRISYSIPVGIVECKLYLSWYDKPVLVYRNYSDF